MKSAMIRLCMLAAVASLPAQSAEPPSPGSATLVEDAKRWDGRTVSLTGEAVGEAMRRGTMAWIHLNDDAYGLHEGAGRLLAGFNSGIGVWVETRQASRIAVFGGYGHHGDVVEVTGVFHAACPLHGGDMDIHADSLRVAKNGHRVEHPVGLRRILAAGMMGALAALLFLVRAILRPRGRPAR